MSAKYKIKFTRNDEIQQVCAEFYSSAANKIYFPYADNQTWKFCYGISVIEIEGITVTENTAYEVEAICQYGTNTVIITINGTEVYRGNSTVESIPQRALFLFASNNTGSKRPAYAKIYSFELVDLDTNSPLAKYVPCVRILDGKPGMYDMVSGTFYTNAGTGEFVVGWYVDDGLVLWLDGLNRGDTPGEWRDLIDDNVCTLTGSYTENSNNVYFPGSKNTYGVFDKQVLVPWNKGTLEFVVQMEEVATTGRPLLAFATNNMGGSVATYGASISQPVIRWWTRGDHDTNSYWGFSSIDTTENKIFTASVSYESGVCNGVSGTKGYISSWSVPNNNVKYLGWRGTGNAFKGYIYGIRLYNRFLSHDEILRNQRVDNKRYELGLVI